MGTSSPADGSSSSEAKDLSTALAVTKDDLAALTQAQRAQIAERKNANIVSAQIAGTNWGKGLDPATRRAVADWGQRHGIDVATEIFVLGGSIYLNAQFYINRLVEMVRTGKVADFKQDMVQHDPRLGEILGEVLPASASEEEKAELREAQAKARREIRRRRDIRIMYGIPDAATAAVVTDVRLTALPNVPFIGVKWAPHGNSRHDDPIGKDYPQETALTRSARRALKQCVRHLPEMIEWLNGAEEDAIATVDVAIKESQKAAAIAAGEQKQLGEGAATEVRTGGAVPEADYVVQELEQAEPIRRPRRSSSDPVPVEPPGADPYDTPPAGTVLVAEDLFGKVSKVEQIAPEKVHPADTAGDDGHDDTEGMSAEELADAARLERRR